MSHKQVVLVTGAAGQWGSRLSERLARLEGLHVIGVDAAAPAEQARDLDFVQTDLQNPALAEFLRAEEVDIVCHVAFVESVVPGPASYKANVESTQKLLRACAEAGVRRAVLKSSTMVYGAHPGNSAFLREGEPLHGSARYGYTRDLVEIERFCSGFQLQAPGLALTILRFASIVGPSSDTPLVRFLTEPRAPSLLGFDPVLQLIHEEDVIEALAHAVLHDVPGTFNVADEGVLPLNRIRGLAGKPPFAVPHAYATWCAGSVWIDSRYLARFWPVESDYLRYRWVADLTQMRQELRFVPRYTAEQAVRDLAQRRDALRLLSDSTVHARSERWLRDAIDRRRQARDRQAELEEETR